MAGLIDCATELLLEIYQFLDSIDDALHLAQSSKCLYAIYDTHRFHILKTIIVSTNSPDVTKIKRTYGFEVAWLTISSSLQAFMPTILNSAISKKFLNPSLLIILPAVRMHLANYIHLRLSLNGVYVQNP